MMHPRHSDLLIFGGSISLLGGVLLRSFITIPFEWYIFFLISAFIVSVFLMKARKIYALFSILFCLLFLIGVFRFEIRSLHQKIAQESFSLQEHYYGTVTSEVIKRPEYQRFVVSLPENVSILVSSSLYPQVSYGDKVKIEGELTRPQNFETDTGREFDYINYLLKDDIYFQMRFARVTIFEEDRKQGLRFYLFAAKYRFIEAVERVIPDPESALLAGILLGADQSLGEELEQDFIDTGTIHIVVLSGYNVTIVSEAIVKGLRTVFSEKLSLAFGAFGVVLFALLSGASTTTVRASLMGLLGLLARVTKRNYDIFRAIAVAACVMVMVNPLILRYDISFQLSFIATLSLVLITPIVESWTFVKKIPNRFGFREIFASTIGVQIGVLPFILYSMGTLSLIAPLANMLVLPIIPLSMGLGFLAGLFELLVGIGSNPVSWVSFAPLHYIVGVVQRLAEFSWSAISVGEFSVIFVLFAYFAISLWVYRRHKMYSANM